MSAMATVATIQTRKKKRMVRESVTAGDEYIANKSEYDFRDMQDVEIIADFEELIRIFTEKYEIGNGPYPQEAVDTIEKYDPDWYESEFSNIGRRISSRIYFWSEGLKMAWEQIKLMEVFLCTESMN